jgi:hypothetical protein
MRRGHYDQTLIVIGNDDVPIHTTIECVAADEGDTGITTVPVTIRFDRAVTGAQQVQVALVGVPGNQDEDSQPGQRMSRSGCSCSFRPAPVGYGLLLSAAAAGLASLRRLRRKNAKP